MSFVVYCKGEDEHVWGPALRVGNYFLDNLKILENLIKISSGITLVMADTIEIDPVILREFVEKTLSFIEETNNTPLVAMMSGMVEIIIELNARANGFYPDATPRNRFLIERAKRVLYPISDYMNLSADSFQPSNS